MWNFVILLLVLTYSVFAVVRQPIPAKPSQKTTPSNFNPQPDPPVAPIAIKSVPLPPEVKPNSCCEMNCLKPSHCEMITPPCGKNPVPTCVCPKGLVLSDCPGCIIFCAELHMGRPCLDVCRPPQCICPEGQLYNSDRKCIPQEKCPRLPEQ